MSTLERCGKYGFRFEMNEPGVLELIFDGPNLNAVDERVHSEIPYVWRVIDEDPDVRVVIVRGSGRAFSAGEESELLDTARRVASKLEAGAQKLIEWNKRALNLSYEQSAPVFEASLAHEFLGFGGPGVRERTASHRERRQPKFVRQSVSA